MLEALRTAVIAPFVDMLFPMRCLACGEMTEARGLCAACWRDTHFITGAACEKCGTPLAGEAMDASGAGIEGIDVCEPCRRRPPAWDRGAAAVLYAGPARRVVLGFKHGDRLDMRDTLAEWMLPAAGPLLARADLVVPVPLHWRRMLRRRYNQSAELARALTRRSGAVLAVDLLRRRRFTSPQEGLDRHARATNQRAAFEVAPRRAARVAGRTVLVVDDVLTTGATLSACAEALREAGAARVDVAVLARVAFADTRSI